MPFGLTGNDFITLFARLIIIFLIMPIHEFAHAWASKKLGDNTAVYMGRYTLNPLAHIDPIGAICLIIVGFGWAKPVPVNPLKFKSPRGGMALTALAGPVSNLIVAFIAVIVLRVVYFLPVMESNYGFAIFYFLNEFIYVNIVLAVFNLLPIPPLDGSRILSYFTPARYEKFIERHYMVIYIIFLLTLTTGILSKPLGVVRSAVFNVMIFLTDWVDSLMMFIMK